MAWKSQILLSSSDDGFHHVNAWIDGDSYVETLLGAQLIFNSFSHGHETWVREEPQATTHTDFDTKAVHHRGFTRLSFRLNDGPLHHMEKGIVPLSFADA